MSNKDLDIEVVVDNTNTDCEIDVKRFYAPIGVTLTCPHCKKRDYYEFTQRAIYYPKPWNTKTRIAVCCYFCEEEIIFDGILRVNIEVA